MINKKPLWSGVSALMLLGTVGFAGYLARDLGDNANGGHAMPFATTAAAQSPAGLLGLGRPATENEIAAWDIDIRPDGAGLPEGQGSVSDGEEVFAEKCAACHGDFAEGVDRWPVLAGGRGTLATHDPVKTVGSYWPYLSTVWDYVHRAMPYGEAQSLTDDEVYAITAYILYSNDLVDDEFVLSNENFTEVRLPNEENFYMDDREQSPLWGPRDVCMENCKDAVEITARARVLDVTPESEEEASATTASETVVASAEPAAAPAPAAFDADLAAEGEKVFNKCKACHQVGDGAKNRVGPILNDIVGAPIGQVDGFRYSNVFVEKAEEGAVWDDASLDAFLANPRGWAKGTKMNFAGLKKDDERAAVIEYLKSVSPSPLRRPPARPDGSPLR